MCFFFKVTKLLHEQEMASLMLSLASLQSKIWTRAFCNSIAIESSLKPFVRPHPAIKAVELIEGKFIDDLLKGKHAGWILSVNVTGESRIYKSMSKPLYKLFSFQLGCFIYWKCIDKRDILKWRNFLFLIFSEIILTLIF